ncbi:DEAD/DEAH box helicase [uncultured Acidaminococcus sp.]|uniref:DEAD/DEAH box helicase n=1 Tax=uncultured Acidaminococcus sp. TaxID=352152 RepID=UPI0026656B7A|nr:DEAD/DEAH box helicase [uncultured Acidaminococcus sp.]
MKFVPHPYQEFCVQAILDKPAVGLFLDMGLGKTAITLTAINELRYGRFAVRKCLVIAPKKVAEATWQREAAKWDNLRHLRFSAVLGSTKQRIKALLSPADIWIINRENVTWLVDYYQNTWPFDMVVIDESSSFKSHSAKRFKSLASIKPHIKRIVELTGTPSPNGLMDLWSQIYLLDGGARLGKYYTHFRDRYFDPGRRGRDVIYQYDPKEGAADAVLSKISDICISMKASDYLQLPDCIVHDIPVELDAKAKKAYNELEKKMVLSLPDGDIDVASAAALSNKLQQLANGALYDDDHQVHLVHDCKIEAFMELIEQLHGQHALVFYNFKHDKDRLLEALAKSKLRVREFTGAREEIDWNAGKIDVLLAHPASTAYGLNLQDGGHHIIWFGLNWSLELYQQANKRLHRQGQKEPVIIHQLICTGTRDEDLVEALGDKDASQEKVLESLKARIKKWRLPK